MKRQTSKQALIFAAFGIVPVIWPGLLIAPAVSGGLLEVLQNLSAVFENPLNISWHEDSLKTVLFCIAVYGFGIGIYLSTRRNKRPREEYGSAKWGNASAVNRKYRDKAFTKNKILTQNVRLGLDGRKHRRKYDTSGKEIVYTVDEARINDYAKKIDGYDIYNSYHPGWNTDLPEPDVPYSPPDANNPGNPGSSPKTGDESNMWLWVTLMIISTAMQVVLQFFKPKNKGKHCRR